MIEIKNLTLLNTKDLRKLIKRSLNEFNSYYFIKHSQSTELHVKIIYKKESKRGQWIGGYAWYNTRSIVIKIPIPLKELNGECCYKLVQVIFHELEHCEGKRHRDMRNHHITPYPTDWAREYTIHSKEVKLSVKSPSNKVIDKINTLEGRKKSWVSKLKRSQNAIKKINTQLKYYEKRKAAVRYGEDKEILKNKELLNHNKKN